MTARPKRRPLDFHPKVAASGLSANLALILLWAASQFGLDVTPEVAGAFVGVVMFAGGWAATSDE